MIQSKLLLFDLDGTLLDSRDFLVSASMEVLDSIFPGVYTVQQIADQFGNGFARYLSDTVSPLNRQVLERFAQIKIDRYGETRLFPGVAEGLTQLKNEGLTLGIVTNQQKQAAVSALRENKVLSLFDVHIAAEDVSEGKPSPEGILKAMKQTGFAAEETVMVGDSRYDIRAAKQAGVTSILLKWYDDSEVPVRDVPDYVFDHFEDFVRMFGVK